MEGTGSAGGNLPDSACAHQHFVAVLGIENVGSVVRAFVSAEAGRIYDLDESAVVAGGAVLASEDGDIGVLGEPLVRIRGINCGKCARAAECILKRCAGGCGAALWRAVILRACQKDGGVRWVRRDRN